MKKKTSIKKKKESLNAPGSLKAEEEELQPLKAWFFGRMT